MKNGKHADFSGIFAKKAIFAKIMKTKGDLLPTPPNAYI